MKNRRDFLKDVCPTVAFAFFGVSFIQACASGDDDVAISNPNNGGNTNSGTNYNIDLTSSSYSALATVGGWVNAGPAGIPVYSYVYQPLKLMHTPTCARTKELIIAGA